MSDGVTRMSPLREDDIGADLRAALRPVTHPRGLDNLFATLARSPRTLEAYLPLGLHLFARSTLPADVREMVVLRVAARTGCEYEAAHHRPIARSVGLAEEHLATAADPKRSPDGPYGPVLAAVDELVDAHRVSDTTWSALGASLAADQLVDLLLTAGFYAMLAGTVNSLGVEPDERVRPGGAGDPDGERRARTDLPPGP